jgi:16S rRNA (adenine1518-N6/adenine1519-N6)-dimethyltransferase
MAQIDDLPPLRDVIAKYGLTAKRQLGQNFLLDLNLTTRIANAAGSLDGRTIIEIGPGPGGLTRALLAAGAKKVIAIERDARVLPALEEISDHYPGRLTIIEGDALATDHAGLAEGPTRIVANLPYNIATVLLTGWLTANPWPPWFESATLLFQKEVAQRICARPGEKPYGRLGVLAGWRTRANIAFNIDRQAFTPAPKVTSSLVHLVPKPVQSEVPVAALEAVTKCAFGQRRKMLRQSLKSLHPDHAAFIAAIGLAGTERAEALSIEQFVGLAGQFEARRTGSDPVDLGL